MHAREDGLYLFLISIHGLIRGQHLELGRDADTGGQTKYVVELSRALAELPQVARVDLLTRQVCDANVAPDYAQAHEQLSPKANIIRLPCGPAEYLAKEQLWDHLDSFADYALSYLREQGRTPDLIHSHYADAAYVGSRLSHLLGIPLVHTGHSLGRVKRRRLLATGLKRGELEARYNLTRRIEAEEDTLAAASLVIASTRNEIEEQYSMYDYYKPDCMAVIPPGTDLEQFHPPDGSEKNFPIYQEVRNFLRDPDKPMVLALSRPDERKNIATLIEAYGESPELQDAANLLLVLGNRNDLRDMENGPLTVLTGMLVLIDAFNLYGKAAYPKRHSAEEVAVIYRMAAASQGVFINPALTEPFGLTLLEAAASGLPLVATEDGGPSDIIGNCQNGLLIDPLDKTAMVEALLAVLTDQDRRRTLIDNGLSGVKRHYSWQAHAEKYLAAITPLLRSESIRKEVPRHQLLYHDRAIVVELDRALLGDAAALRELIELIRRHRKKSGFAIATGRSLESTLAMLKKNDIQVPDVLIVGMGTEIYYTQELTADEAWTRHIDYQWNPRAVRHVLDGLPGLKLQPKSEQLRFKLSYYIDPNQAPPLDEINRLLRKEEVAVHVFLSYGQFLDILPYRASKGFALRYFANQYEIPLERLLVAGGTAGDEDMMRGNMLAVAVNNPHRQELTQLSDVEQVYFSEGQFARGILEAIDYYDFFGACRVPPPS